MQEYEQLRKHIAEGISQANRKEFSKKTVQEIVSEEKQKYEQLKKHVARGIAQADRSEITTINSKEELYQLFEDIK